ncbi:tetraacyldisaccharide 4'-kinase [Granulosicoccus sp. 3-233]|uniref:tetraacyldisaccharide 4'-kinase n=1 Tax=Granulosicoccus sp. 3-233 TaxID=3417969 RepID=UPI003D32D6A0
MKSLPRFWQLRSWRACVLWPISWLFSWLLRGRRLLYRLGVLRTVPSRLPVIVVGNLSVGGTGKTPLCAELVSRFRQAGWKPAIVSRGYGGPRYEQPHLLTDEDTPSTAGDEPVMLYQQCAVPVCVCVDRAAAVARIVRDTDADVVFSDDGLQHLRMERVADIVVIDGVRGLGNRWLMPAGPLREPPSRLAAADLIAIQAPFTGKEPADDWLHRSLQKVFGRHVDGEVQNQTFQLLPGRLRQLSSGQCVDMASMVGRRVHAVAGIGNPQRFFDSLAACGLQVDAHPLPDHHRFTLDDLSFDDDDPVLITSKDAVKLQAMTGLTDKVHEVAVQIQLNDELARAIDALERTLRQSRQTDCLTPHCRGFSGR